MKTIIHTILSFYILFFINAQIFSAPSKKNQAKATGYYNSAEDYYKSCDIPHAEIEIMLALKLWKDNPPFVQLNERIKTVLNDKLPPEINVPETVVTKDNPYNLTFVVIDDHELGYIIVDNKKIDYYLSVEGKVEKLVSLDAEKTDVNIKAVDRRGNAIEKNVEILLDSIPPKILITTPDKKVVNSTENKVLVKGIVEDNYGLEGIKIGKKVVTPKKQKYEIDETITLVDGNNDIYIVARDIVGNSSVEQLQVKYNKPKPGIAVLDFTNRNVSELDSGVISDTIRSALVKSGNVNVVDRNNMERILTEQQFVMSTCGSAECAMKIGQLLQVQKIVVGTLSKLPNGYALTISLIDVESGKIIISEMETCITISELLDFAKRIATVISDKSTR